MSFVIKFAKTVRNHWKKSLAFTLISAYGLNYGKGKYDEELMRRDYCLKAQEYGDQYLGGYQKPRKITVFLNPAAYDGKARSLFEKNAAPLLNLAGLEVNVVKTEYDGQIKEFVKYLELKHCDGLVVAGGDGSVLETVTALMRKEDQTFRKKVPLGIIPVGETNKFAAHFYGPQLEDAKKMMEAAMSVIKGVDEKVDILKIQADDGRSTFSLCGLEAGAYRDSREKTKKYWYFGPLKHRFTYVRPTMSTWPPRLKGSLEYVLATEDNNNNNSSKPRPPKIEPKEEPTQQPAQSRTWASWLSWLLFGLVKPTDNRKVVKEEDEEAEEEIDDSEAVSRDLNNMELVMNSRFTTPKQDKKLSGIELELGPETVERTGFISEGWNRMKGKPWEMGSSTNEKLLVKKVKYIPEVKEESPVWFNIDGEHFEAMPVEVTLLRNRLRLFTNSTENLQFR